MAFAELAAFAPWSPLSDFTQRPIPMSVVPLGHAEEKPDPAAFSNRLRVRAAPRRHACFAVDLNCCGLEEEEKKTHRKLNAMRHVVKNMKHFASVETAVQQCGIMSRVSWRLQWTP